MIRNEKVVIIEVDKLTALRDELLKEAAHEQDAINSVYKFGQYDLINQILRRCL